jgi:hypothetical protein
MPLAGLCEEAFRAPREKCIGLDAGSRDLTALAASLTVPAGRMRGLGPRAGLIGVAAVLAALIGAAGVAYWLRGTPVPSPMPPHPTTAVAHLTAFEGAVQVKRWGRVDWIAAAQTMPLGAGDLVLTKPRAAAEITYLDGFVVRVLPDTLLTVGPAPSEEHAPALDLSAGTIVGDAIRGGADAVITTPSTRWEGVGAGGDPPLVDLQTTPSHETTVDQRRGRGRVVPRTGETLVLDPRTRVVVDAGGQAGAVVALPAAPVLLSPQPAATFSYREVAQGVTRLAWSPVPGAASYHLLVDHGAFFLGPTVDRSDLHQTSWEMTGLPEGK